MLFLPVPVIAGLEPLNLGSVVNGSTTELPPQPLEFNLEPILQKSPFVQLGFTLSNGVTDTLEYTSILIYLQTHIGLYLQKWG